jgi:hypothetical protein
VAATVAMTALGLAALIFWPVGGDRAGDEPNPLHAAPTTGRLSLERKPYLAVSCPRPNEFACDRVGLAIWLRKPAARLAATINGKRLAMHLPCWKGANGRACGSYCREQGVRCGTYYQGFLHRAGVVHGSLKVRPDRGRDLWIGTRPPLGDVRIIARYRDGRTATARVKVRLSPGWG